ncbi:MAG: excinuclease ABC subunit UvrC [Planctomycetota bacterium]
MDTLPEVLRRKLDALPADPGVYVLLDKLGRAIYVGKAASLRSRVRSYFQPGADDGRPLFHAIVERTADLECIVCTTEVEALLLENNLIKKHRPRFNVRLRDDKTYVSLRVTLSEKWPRVQVVRQWRNDGNLYFGPYGSAGAVREMLRVIKRYFPLRTCSNGFFNSRRRPCIEYEIGHCSAPCVDLISADDYRKWVDEASLFLRGRNDTLLPLLAARMEESAASHDFERAARVRDQIGAIRQVMERQKVQEVKLGDLDVFGYYRRHDHVTVHVLLSREGKLQHSSSHAFRSLLPDAQLLRSFLAQYYSIDRQLAAEVLLPIDIDEPELIAEWLSARREAKVKLHVPQRGPRHELVQMACRNAEVHAAADTLKQAAEAALAERLGALFGLDQPLDRLECFDIAHFQGSYTVASRVVFEDGEPLTAQYRRYKIQHAASNDDFAAMQEVITRRFRPSPKREALPDLVLIDGGKGQLNAALEALRAIGVELAVAGIAKERHRGGRHTTERIFVPARGDPLELAPNTPESLFLQRVRDEAHRFANSFHRELSRRRTLLSGLEDIAGVGERRRAALLGHFGSLRALRAASVAEIASVPGMTQKSAAATYAFLHADESTEAD